MEQRSFSFKKNRFGFWQIKPHQHIGALRGVWHHFCLCDSCMPFVCVCVCVSCYLTAHHTPGGAELQHVKAGKASVFHRAASDGSSSIWRWDKETSHTHTHTSICTLITALNTRVVRCLINYKILSSSAWLIYEEPTVFPLTAALWQ